MSEILIGRTWNYKLNANPQGTAAAGTATTPTAAKDNRTVVGYCSIFGNSDSIADIVIPGAFKKAVADFHAGRSRCRFLWNHLQEAPPCAVITDLKEVKRSELPAALRQFPDVTGALQVTRRYFTDDFSERVYQGVLTGGIKEMSFAFNVTDYEYTIVGGQKVRLLKALELIDASDVNYGCNNLAMANVPKGVHVLSSAKILELRAKNLKNAVLRERLARFKFSIKHPEFQETDKSSEVLARAREMVAGWS
jgi:HK97 family phage prohead protease